MAEANLPSPDLLRKFLNYDPETGALVWRPRAPEFFQPGNKGSLGASKCWNKKYAGKAPGTLDSNGYLRFRIQGKCLKAHRVIWSIYYGEWPEDCIDHINHDRTDNRIANLRVVSRQENSRNRSFPATNTSGQMGVVRDPASGTWRATIRAARDGKSKNIHLGCFAELSDAVLARKEAERRLGYHPNHGKMLHFSEGRTKA